MTFDQLMREHDAIDVLTLRLETLCTAARPDIDRVIAVRKDLRDTLEEHLGHEDEAIYTKLIAALGQPAEAAQTFAASFADLRIDWGSYLEEWNAECLAIDWASFCDETRRLMARVRDRTRQETGLLYPLALQIGAVSLRAA